MPTEIGDTMLKRENISDKLADAIGKKIIHNELKSGEIITETQISKEWDISRSPVRDALHILKTHRLLEKSSKGQYMVPVLNADYVENVFDAINMFYQYSFSQATKHIMDNDKEFLLAITEKIDKSIGYDDIDIYLESVTIFGHKVLQIARNPIIEKSGRDLMPTIERVQFAAYEIEPSYPEKSMRPLRDCYKHLSIRAPRKAAKSLNDFANISKLILLNHFKDTEKK
jgi:DNA-binding GntR family transcriptional regulator